MKTSRKSVDREDYTYKGWKFIPPQYADRTVPSTATEAKVGVVFYKPRDKATILAARDNSHIVMGEVQSCFISGIPI